MKILYLLILISLPVFACKNRIPESEARKAIALEAGAGSKSCADLPDEKCLCYDGVDWYSVDLIDGQLIENSDKKFAKELKERNEKDTLKAKAEKRRNFELKGKTILELKAELNEWIQLHKE
jgi:hypothetical protein